MIRILLVAAYAAVRAGLHVLLADEEEFEVVEEVGGSDELAMLVRSLAPDVVVYDVQEGDLCAILAAMEGSTAGLVALTENRNDVRLLAGSPVSGWGALLKDADGPTLAGAIHAVAAGLISLDRSLAPLLTSPSVSVTAEAPGETLTTREREVLQLMAQGLPNKNIAARLHISQHTVKFHVASILAKLGATSRTEAVTLGARRGHVTL